MITGSDVCGAMDLLPNASWFLGNSMAANLTVNLLRILDIFIVDPIVSTHSFLIICYKLLSPSPRYFFHKSDGRAKHGSFQGAVLVSGPRLGENYPFELRDTH